MPGLYTTGHIGIISRSDVNLKLWSAIERLGQSTAIGIGGDPIIGTKFLDALKLFKDDDETKAVVMIGEIGGTADEDAAAYVKAYYEKPVVGFIAGRTAPPGRRMGHAGAIIAGGKGSAEDKMATCGMQVFMFVIALLK